MGERMGMTTPTLTWQDCSTGRKLAMLGEHEVSAVFPPHTPEGRWHASFFLHRLRYGMVEINARTGFGSEHAARGALLEAFAHWWRKAGLA